MHFLEGLTAHDSKIHSINIHHELRFRSQDFLQLFFLVLQFMGKRAFWALLGFCGCSTSNGHYMAVLRVRYKVLTLNKQVFFYTFSNNFDNHLIQSFLPAAPPTGTEGNESLKRFLVRKVCNHNQVPDNKNKSKIQID